MLIEMTYTDEQPTTRIMIFGKPGGGKSTLGKRISQATGIQLHPLDLIEFNPDGTRVSNEIFAKLHEDLLNRENWIIEGFGTPELFWCRVARANTLIYVDLPYSLHYWWVTKRLLSALVKRPEGWPEGSSVLKGTFASLGTLRKSPRFWNQQFVTKLEQRGSGKAFFHIREVRQLNDFTSSSIRQNGQT